MMIESVFDCVCFFDTINHLDHHSLFHIFEATLVPRRFLVGSLPDALLDSFEFWRARPDRLVGNRDATKTHTIRTSIGVPERGPFP